MRIWTKCVLNGDGRVIEEESSWIEYDGPVAECAGGSKTTVVPAQPTAEERALTTKQVELATFQLEELRRQSALQQEFGEQIGPLLDVQAEQAAAALAESERLAPIRQELLDLTLEDLRRGGAASPKQIRLIEEAGSAALARGETDIERFSTQSLEALGEVLAPSLGLRPSDTPILDRGALVAAEATRQGGQLTQGIRGAEATARLNFPLAQSQLLQATALGQQSLQEATRQFQDQLRQQAFTNRLNLQGLSGQLGLGLATGFSVPFPGIQRGRTETTSGGLGLTGLGRVLGGAGGLLSGLGAAGFFAPAAAALPSFAPALAIGFASSHELKRDPERSDSGMRDITHEVTLEKLEDLPVERWRYKEGLGLGEGDHIGPYSEDFKETFGLGDGKTINIIDAVGIGLSATKGLAKKVKLLEHAAHAA